MAIKITLESFLAVIKRSHLLTEEQVDVAVEKFRAAKGVTTDGKPFAEFLVRNKLLTVWQAEKVLQGKHKGFFLGRYRLLSLLGKGGMSSVYLAEHTVMKRHCALKVLPAKRVNDASYLGRFHREAQAVAALDHPNIVRAYDVDMAADAGVDIHFLAMEFVKGKSLLELVQEIGPVPIVDAAEMVRQSAQGLDHAHRAGLVHRDVKPGNLLVTPTGMIKVLDLGLARFFDDEDHSLTVQHDEKVLGTADYISPEQAIDSHKVDRRTDIYSLGCTLYYLLCGHPPFNSGPLAQRLIAHQTKPAPPILAERPDVPAGLVAIMEKMMAKKADQRYQTAQEVADAISTWQKNAAVTTAPAPAVVVSTVVAKPATNAVRAPARQTGTTRLPTPAKKQPDQRVDASDPLGSFLAGLSSHIDQVDPAPSDSKTSNSSSKRMSQAAVETSKLNDSKTKVVAPVFPVPPATPESDSEFVDLDLLDEVFDPSRLNLDGLEADTPDVLDLPVEPLTPPAKTIAERSTRSTSPRKLGSFQMPARPVWWAIGGAAVLVVVGLVGWIVFSGDSNPPRISQSSKPAKSLPSSDLAVIEVGPEGHFTTIGQALAFVRETFHPFGAIETRTVLVAGGFTYSETIHLVNTGRGRFPRNVILKSSGPVPAVIQGHGTGPVLHVNGIESLTIEGFVIDAKGAETAVQVAGNSPNGRLTSLSVRNFSQVGVRLEGLSVPPGEEYQLSGINIQSQSPEAVGILCQSTNGQSTSSVTMDHLRIIGPLRAGVEITGTCSKFSISESLFAKCAAGIRLENVTLVDVSLVNNTLAQNERGIAFAQSPDSASHNLRVCHTLFSENQLADAVVEAGDPTGLADKLLLPVDGRHHNRSDRKDPDANGLDLFTGDGQRGVATSFVSADPANPGYLKPSTTDVKVAAPAAGAKEYIGAIAP